MVDVAVIGSNIEALSVVLNLSVKRKTVQLFTGEEKELSCSELIKNQSKYRKGDISYLMEMLFEKMKNSYSVFPYSGKITGISSFNSQFMINVKNVIYEANCVVLANDVLVDDKIPGENKFLNSGISYHPASDGRLYIGKKVVVCGETVNAFKEANFLKSIGVDVTFVSDINLLGLIQGIKKIKGKIEAVLGDAKVKCVVINGEKIKTDALFIIRSFIPPESILSNLKTNEDGNIVTDKNFATSISGVYAVGTCTHPLESIQKSIGNALKVSSSVTDYLNDKNKLEEIYS